MSGSSFLVEGVIVRPTGRISDYADGGLLENVRRL